MLSRTRADDSGPRRPAPRRRLKRLVQGVAVLAATSMLVAACGGGSSEKDSTGGTLTLGVDVAPRSWDPAQQVSAGTGVVLWQPVYDTLLKYAPDGSIEPNAAESFSYNEDRTALTLKLRDGMTFTDGAAVDAAAAKASLEHMRDSAGPDSVRLAGSRWKFSTIELSNCRQNALTRCLHSS